MIRVSTLLALALAALTLTPAAQAQWQPVGPALPSGGGQTVQCESLDGDFRECRTPFANMPVLVNQLSSSDCVEGQSWGSRAPGTVWVARGCRGQFAEGHGGQRPPGGGWNPGGGSIDERNAVRCESDDGRYRECRAPMGVRLALLRQESQTPCVEGQSWGSRGNGSVWVNGGCRGVFGVAGWGGSGGGGAIGGEAYRCESMEGRLNECRAPQRGRQVLVRQLSDSACIEGQTWGSRDGGVWVQGGCRGEFAAAGGWGGGGGWGQGGGRYEVDCASEDRRYNQCRWDSRQGRPVLIEQYSEDACREGRSWGYDGRRLWVDRGCRARFGAR